MLAIVEVLKEYRNFLLGASITIYTDHKHLLSQTSDKNRVFRWKQKLEEYGTALIYVKGLDDVLLKALQRESRFFNSNTFGTKLIKYNPLRSDSHYVVIPISYSTLQLDRNIIFGTC